MSAALGQPMGEASFEELKQQLSALPPVDGITPPDVLDLPDPLPRALKKMLRTPLTLEDMAAELSLASGPARQIGDLLVEKGYLRREELPDGGGVRYKVRLTHTRTHRLPVEF
jgi:hypothetical protein